MAKPQFDNTILPIGAQLTIDNNENIIVSEQLVNLLVTARETYDWPSGTGATSSQQKIIDLEINVANFIAALNPAAEIGDSHF